MTLCTRVITKDVDEDMAMRKIENKEEMEDVDVATKIWEGAAIATRMATAHILEALAEHRGQHITTKRRLQI